MIDKIEKIANIFFIFLGYIGMAALVVFLVFIENPVRYFFYALSITTFIHFKNFRYLRIDFKKVGGNFLLTISIIYLSLITILSVSPFLTIQEFKISHFTWKPVEAKTIKSSSFWDTGYKRRGNSYATIYYEYQADGKRYKNSEPEALKKYYPIWNTSKTDDLIIEFSKSVSEKIKNKDYIIFKSPNHHDKSRLFLSTDIIYFQGSLLYNMATSMATIILTILGLLSIILIFSGKSRQK
ncbi:hypothetical protein [Chryseobacterium paludis]|uniref:hypothetical protein n=1 Tax=Chryseobacterium paludis TaxID=2956784 RepID=UPI0021BF1B6F|nr:hypothetical protein [Chryseobacterium paludis]